MSRIAIALLFLLLPGLLLAQTREHRVAIVIHGGAGTIRKATMKPEVEERYRKELTDALMAGYTILKNNGSSLDAVEAVIRLMEDSPIFNAGKGAVFTHEGTNELDASIMEGAGLKAGAVAAVKHIRNPISLARMVMERSKHVMLVGDGAEAFAKQQGVDTVPQSYFHTQRRWEELQKAIQLEKGVDSVSDKHGTVGCVALDSRGTIAAGTSTGGITNKRFGRVGDSPIIGAGTYADNRTCGVSATGDGEYFIRAGVARSVAAMMAYRNLSVQAACDSAMAAVGALGGTGGVLAIDRNGQIGISFNTEGMYRAWIDENGAPVIKIYRE